MSSSSESSVGGEESTEGGGSVGGSGGESTGGSTEGSVDSSPELGKEGPLPELAVYIKAFESARSKGLKYQTDGNVGGHRAVLNCTGCAEVFYELKKLAESTFSGTAKWVIQAKQTEHSSLCVSVPKLIPIKQLAKMPDIVRVLKTLGIQKGAGASYKQISKSLAGTVGVEMTSCQVSCLKREVRKNIEDEDRKSYSYLSSYLKQYVMNNPTGVAYLSLTDEAGARYDRRFTCTETGVATVDVLKGGEEAASKKFKFESIIIIPPWSVYLLPVMPNMFGFDGTYHKQIKGVLLTLVGRLANNNNVLLAFGYYPSESEATYVEFMEAIKHDLPNIDTPGTVCISDRDKGLANAVEIVFPTWHHMWDYPHLQRNIKHQVGVDVASKDLLPVTTARTLSRFRKELKSLQDTYGKEVVDYLETRTPNKEHWCLAHAANKGIRLWGILACPCEQVNSQLKSMGVKTASVLDIIKISLQGFANHIHGVLQNLLTHNKDKYLIDYIAKTWKEETGHSSKYNVQSITPPGGAVVVNRLNEKTYNVDCDKMTCSGECIVPQQEGRPCVHLYVAAEAHKRLDKDFLFNCYHSMYKLDEAMKALQQVSFSPVDMENLEMEEDIIPPEMRPPMKKRVLKSGRIPSQGEKGNKSTMTESVAPSLVSDLVPDLVSDAIPGADLVPDLNPDLNSDLNPDLTDLNLDLIPASSLSPTLSPDTETENFKGIVKSKRFREPNRKFSGYSLSYGNSKLAKRRKLQKRAFAAHNKGNLKRKRGMSSGYMKGKRARM
jgi:hypothetical protein